MKSTILTEERPSLKTKTRAFAQSIPVDEFLTTRELMRLLKIKHKQTVYSLIGEGLPTILVGKSYRFIKNEVIGFLKQHSNHHHSKRLSGKR